MWNEIDHCLWQLSDNITSTEDLWNKIQLVWNQIDAEFCLKLINTISRVKDVLKANGNIWDGDSFVKKN